MVQGDWYEATVLDNSILGSPFAIGGMCAFRRFRKTKFTVFNMEDTLKTISVGEAKTQLKSSRTVKNALVRSGDQGYLNWKVSEIK